MRLLIAGWHGQIARALVELAPGRSDVTALSVGRPALDLCNPASIRSTFDEAEPDVMINTAAYTAVDRAEHEPEAALRLNTTGAEAFATIAAKKNVPVIHLSTDYVFDGTKVGAYTEDDAPAPASVYGRTKLDGERAVAAATARHVILRVAWVHSPFGRNFVKTMLARALDTDAIDVVDDQVGCPTYALTLADAILDVAAHVVDKGSQAPWGTYHAASAGEASWCAFARRVFEASAQVGGPTARVNPISHADYPTDAPRPHNARLDSSKFASTFGCAFPAWEEGVDRCVSRLLDPDDGA